MDFIYVNFSRLFLWMNVSKAFSGSHIYWHSLFIRVNVPDTVKRGCEPAAHTGSPQPNVRTLCSAALQRHENLLNKLEATGRSTEGNGGRARSCNVPAAFWMSLKSKEETGSWVGPVSCKDISCNGFFPPMTNEFIFKFEAIFAPFFFNEHSTQTKERFQQFYILTQCTRTETYKMKKELTWIILHTWIKAIQGLVFV